MVRAKFKCDGIQPFTAQRVKRDADGNPVVVDGANQLEDFDVYTIKLEPVMPGIDPNHENAKFFQSTPSGLIQLRTVNEAAAKQFEVGKEYYVDFTPAPVKEPSPAATESGS